MGKSVPSPPPAPDPVATANAQGASNKETAIAQGRLNAVNQNSPYGTVTYTETPNPNDPSVPNFTQNVTFSPQQQSLYNTGLGIEQQAANTAGQALSNVQNTLSSPFSLSGLPTLQTGVKAGYLPSSAADFQAQGDATTNALMQRFNTDWNNQQEATQAQLNAQGAQLGSKQYDVANDQLNRARNDALSQALLAGNQEQNTLFGQQLASQGQQFSQGQQNAALQNQGRQQAISEQQLVRSQPINEIATLLGLGGGIQTPTGAPNFGVNIGNTDVLGAYGLQQQALQNNYNQQLAARNAGIGALGNLFGTLGGAALLSDRRKKTAIRRAGRTANGTPLYVYAYKDRPNVEMVGVMAQDMMRLNPLAVHERNGAYLVDYGRVM